MQADGTSTRHLPHPTLRRTCQHARTAPPGVTTTRSSTAQTCQIIVYPTKQINRNCPTCQHARTAPPGVTTTRSSTACSGQAAAPTARIAASSASTCAGVAGTGSYTTGSGAAWKGAVPVKRPGRRPKWGGCWLWLPPLQLRVPGGQAVDPAEGLAAIVSKVRHDTTAEPHPVQQCAARGCRSCRLNQAKSQMRAEKDGCRGGGQGGGGGPGHASSAAAQQARKAGQAVQI